MSDHPDPLSARSQEVFSASSTVTEIRDGRLSRDDDDYKQGNDVYKVFTHTEHPPLQRPTSRESRT